MAETHQVTIRGDAGKLREFADGLNGRRVRDGVRAFAIPADNESYSEAIDNGAIKALHTAGFTICNPGTTDPATAQGETTKTWPGEQLDTLLKSIC